MKIYLRKKGILFKRISKDSLPVVVKGPLVPGTYQIKGNVSSQFISGLLFALPLLKEDSKIVLLPPVESVDYIIMTIDVLNKFGVKVNYENQIIDIPGNQSYHSAELCVEGDFSQAAFWMVAGTIGHPIKLYGLDQKKFTR